jgi:hypothetical protein
VCLLQGRVIAMVIAEPHAHPGFLRGGLHGAELGGVERAGFFDEYMFARAYRGQHDGGKFCVERRNDNGGNSGVVQCGGVVADGLAAWRNPGDFRRPGAVEIASITQRNSADFDQGRGAFTANQAAADLGELELR